MMAPWRIFLFQIYSCDVQLGYMCLTDSVECFTHHTVPYCSHLSKWLMTFRLLSHSVMISVNVVSGVYSEYCLHYSSFHSMSFHWFQVVVTPCCHTHMHHVRLQQHLNQNLITVGRYLCSYLITPLVQSADLSFSAFPRHLKKYKTEMFLDVAANYV